MTINTDQVSSSEINELNRSIKKRMLQVVLQLLITSALLFLIAGTLNWPMAWALIAVQLGVLVFNALYLLPRNPEAVAERSAIKAGTKGWDRVVISLISVAAIALLVVSGLDYRFGWSPAYALWIHILGLIGVALGNLLFSWALASNKFFATTVRIQE